MARIPLQPAQRSLETGGVPRYSTDTPVADALGGLGRELGQLAARRQEMRETREAFQATIADNEMDAQLDALPTQMLETAPADGSGLHDTAVGQIDGQGRPKPGLFDKIADEFRKRIPPSQLEKFNARLEEKRIRLGTKMAAIQFDQEQQYYAVETQRILGDVTNNILQSDGSTETFGSFMQRGAEVIQTSGLQPLAKKVALEKWKATAAESLFQARLAKDPEAAAKGREWLGVAPLATPQSVSAGGAASLIRQFEGFRTGTYWDKTAFRLGYGTDTITAPDGTFRRVQEGDTITKADAERDLARRVREFEAGAAAKVGPTWQQLPANARAALTSVAYNYGSLPGSVVAAAKTGDVNAIAGAVASLGSNPERRQKEAAIIRGQSVDLGKADPVFDAIPAERRLVLARQADVQQNQNSAEYTTGLADYVASLRDGRDDPSLAYTPDKLFDMLPPDAAVSAQQQIDAARAYGRDKAALEFASPGEVESILTRRAELMNTPENFRQEAQDLAGLQSVLKARNEAIKVDPAAYVAQQPAIGAAYQAMADAPTNPEAAKRYAIATLAEQTRLGVPRDMQRVLPAQQAASIAARFNDQGEGSQNAAALMRSLESQWGSTWPKVFGELAATKQLPGTALVVGAMNRPDQRRAAEALAAAAAIGTTDLEKAVSTTTKQTVDDEVDRLMDEFGATLTSNGASGSSTFLTFREGVYQLALSYARSEQPSEAASRAYADVIQRGYSIHNTYRVPVEYDGDDVADNAEDILDRLTGEGIILPASGLDEATTREAYVRQLQTRGYWVTAGDESGLTLFDETGTAVRKADGSPLTYSWTDILAFGATAGPVGTIEGQTERGNIDLETRPRVQNADGTISTVRSMSFEEDGREVLIPTVSPDGKILSDDAAIALYRSTGKHLGKFSSAEAATAYANRLHDAQEAYYSRQPSSTQGSAYERQLMEQRARQAGQFGGQP